MVSIPYLIFCDLVPPFYTCGFTNVVFEQIATIVVAPITSTIMPLIILIILGLLTSRNIRLVTHHHAQQQRSRNRLLAWEQQITRMMIAQTIVSILCTTPRAALFVYVATTLRNNIVQSIDQVVIIELMNQITLMLLGINYVSPFYLFFFVSQRFRQTIKITLKNFFRLRSNQIDSVSYVAPITSK